MSLNVSAGPAIIHYQPYVGDTFSRKLTIKEGDPLALVDITADDFRIIVETTDNYTLLHTLTIGDGIERTDDGEITWTFTDAQTATWTPNLRLRYDLKWTRSTGEVRTLQAGNIIPQKFISN